MTSNKKQAAIGFIFITMLIDITGWGIIIPVIPKLIKELIHGDVSEAAKYGGWLTFAYAITQFMFAPLIGNLSDKFGRRPIILISLFAFSLDYILLAFAPTITWLFIGRIIAGLTGASISTASAYIADVSTPENRAKNFGMIGVAFWTRIYNWTCNWRSFGALRIQNSVLCSSCFVHAQFSVWLFYFAGIIIKRK